jgi:hypothetical protein
LRCFCSSSLPLQWLNWDSIPIDLIDWMEEVGGEMTPRFLMFSPFSAHHIPSPSNILTLLFLTLQHFLLR